MKKPAGSVQSRKIYSLLNKATGVSILGFNLFKSSNQIVETFNFKNARADLELPETMELFYIDMTTSEIAMATGLSEKHVLELVDKARKDRKVIEPAPEYKTRKPRQKI